MSEQNSAQEKTEEASQQKLKKSREEGQVARSKDLSTTLSLLVTLFALKFSAGLFEEGLQESFRLAYIDFTHSEIGLDDLSLILGHNLLIFIKLLAPLLITPLLVVVFSLVPGGWVFSSKNFTPKLSKLNPITGLGRMFSMQNWSELLKSVLKILVLFAIAGWLLAEATPQLIALQRTDIRTAIGGAVALAFDMTLSLLLVFVLFSLIDIPLQRFFFLKKLRMTKQERKEEHKNQEGRPEVKARIKQLQRQLLQRQISRVIKNADVVIVNPQHFAVALKYDPKKAQAPYVIAKGVDETALYIRKMAQASQLEVLELPPLARAIYFSTQVNQQIPAPLYTAVAHVLTYILQLKAYRQGRRGRPVLAANLPIPDSMANRSQP
ncbi:flagellar biosynthesis protein FlhB [Pseudomonas sp. PIC25]|uniref:flagellar biosynthesis protein FlhB n=1 Tax=Pseudomonas sp. PIC25 TaxID=1958773 RepID=UPI000BAB8663|nr:flagellar biosynthesis protein FlhB [Pseudomonas sp. PIC25]PAU53855.1 flagellar biosynthesis protein FlhB [Pseudomonas sp. PIC25]